MLYGWMWMGSIDAGQNGRRSMHAVRQADSMSGNPKVREIEKCEYEGEWQSMMDEVQGTGIEY